MLWAALDGGVYGFFETPPRIGVQVVAARGGLGDFGLRHCVSGVMVNFKFPLDPTTDKWAAHFHAIGAITLAWNELEDWVTHTLESLTRFDDAAAEYFVGAVGNITLAGLIARLARSIDRRPELVDAIDHLLLGFDICRENRNAVLHSRVLNNALTGDTWLSRRVKSGGFNNVPVDLPTLQRVATEIDAFANYALEVYIYILGHPELSATPIFKRLFDSGPPPALPSKPPLPNRRSPSPPASDQRTSPHPQRPSRAIRKAQRKALWKKPKA